MRLSLWKPALKTWLEGKIPIDSYYLDNPQIGQTNAFLPPLRNVNYTQVDYNTVRGYGIQDILIVRRYPATMAYQDLPLAEMEGVHSTLSIRLTLEAEDIAALERLEVLSVDDPVHLEEIGDRQGDWLVRLHWAFSLTWYAEPETGVIMPPYTIRSIDLALYRQYIDSTDSTLDYHVHLPSGS